MTSSTSSTFPENPFSDDNSNVHLEIPIPRSQSIGSSGHLQLPPSSKFGSKVQSQLSKSSSLSSSPFSDGNTSSIMETDNMVSRSSTKIKRLQSQSQSQSQSGITRRKKGWKNSNSYKRLRNIFRKDSVARQASLSDDAKNDDQKLNPAKDPRDRKHEKRTIVFNRNLPDHMLEPDTGLPITTYHRNKIVTAKYTALTFFPKTIWNQFSRDIANNYFLFLIILGVFPIFGVPSPALAAGPLIVIVCITALKDAVEDCQRTASDMEVNNQPTHILSQICDSASGYVYFNRNVDDESISVWRRFKKWNTKFLLTSLRTLKRYTTRDGRRAAKAQDGALAHSEINRKSFDSIADFKRSSVVPSTFRHSTAYTKRFSSMAKEKTLGFEKKTWKEIKVGDVLRIHNNEEIPADLLILSSSDEDNGCFVETKNLDGETNLKLKQSLMFSTDPHKVTRADNLIDMNFEINSEGPQPNLYSYEGAVVYEVNGDVRQESASINNLILRGCHLRNTRWMIGVVVFTGDDTKIMLNSGATKTKKSRISRELNYYVIMNFVFLFVMCLITGIASGMYYKTSNTSREYFEFGTIAGTPFKNGLVNFFVAIIIYQALVPISLYITIEIIKSLQAYFISSDLGLYYEKIDFPCNPRSWSISDDLGQVEYIFSDKTGTLTQNLMEFRKCTINGVSYGRAYTEALAGLRKRLGHNVEEEAKIEKKAIAIDRDDMIHELRTISKNLYDVDGSLVSKELVRDLKGASGIRQKACNEEFWLALALCHSVLLEDDPKHSGKKILKAQSPDEAALVETARSLGFIFSAKMRKGYQVRVQGQKREYQVLNILEFDSTRKRMSVIVKFPSEGATKKSKIVLFCKGADSIIYSRLSTNNNKAPLLESTSRHLEEYATEGLRTLCIAKRELTPSQYEAWNTEYLKASSSLDNRDAQVEAVADSIERELILLGGTAIEDRLQDGVPESIAILGQAGIKLWVLTGDKVETAINIGFSCNLLGNDMELLVLKHDLSHDEKIKHGIWPSASNDAVIENLIDRYLNQYFFMSGSYEELEEAKDDHSAPNDKFGVVIDGDALKLALANPDIQRKFLLLCKQCRAVLCCRVSPAQKASVVKMVKDTLDVMTLAIGDGSNDVAMIQAADVGVGIAGEEGRQAAMSSDYAIGQFRYLTRLLLTHGRWSYKRFAEMIPCFFYKNVNFTLALFWYSVSNDFDGSYLFEFTHLILFNLLFSSLPVIFLAVFDQDVSAKVSMLVPELYRAGIMRTEFTETAFWIYVCDGVYQSMVAFFFPFIAYSKTFQLMNGLNSDHRFYVGTLVAGISSVSVNLFVWMRQSRWDYISFLANLFSNLIFFIWTEVWTLGPWSGEFYQAGNVMFGHPVFWACLALGVMISLLPRSIYDIIQKLYFPKDTDIIREQEKMGNFTHYPENYDSTDPNRENFDVSSNSGMEPMESMEPMEPMEPALAQSFVYPEVSPSPNENMSVSGPISKHDFSRRKALTESYYKETTSIINIYNPHRFTFNPSKKLDSSSDIHLVNMSTESVAGNRGWKEPK